MSEIRAEVRVLDGEKIYLVIITSAYEEMWECRSLTLAQDLCDRINEFARVKRLWEESETAAIKLQQENQKLREKNKELLGVMEVSGIHELNFFEEKSILDLEKAIRNAQEKGEQEAKAQGLLDKQEQSHQECPSLPICPRYKCRSYNAMGNNCHICKRVYRPDSMKDYFEPVKEVL